MATDLSLVFDRIKTLATIRTAFEARDKNTQLKKCKVSKGSYLFDDPFFSLEDDFVSDWKDIDESNPDKTIQQIFDIDLTKHQRRFLEDDDVTSPLVDFDVDMPEERFPLDFEFDEQGNIVDSAGQKLLSLLADLNLGEDFSASGAVVDNLLQPMHSNSISNDTHLATTLNLTEASVTQLPKGTYPKKRRLLVDPVATIGSSRRARLKVSLSYTEKETVESLIRSESFSRPPYVNLCYRMALGSYLTKDIPIEALPLILRHPGATNLESFLKELGDIERGRDVVIGRPSLSFVDEIPRRLSDDEEFHVDLDLESLSSMDATEYSNSETYASEISSEIYQFEAFLRAQADTLYEKNGLEALTFQRLIPSILDNNWDYVTPRIAAVSFSYLLELATRGVVGLSTNDEQNIVIQFLKA